MKIDIEWDHIYFEVNGHQFDSYNELRKAISMKSFL
jgi:hypothetical protein